MKKKLKILGISLIITVIWVLAAGCQEGICIGNDGGSSLSDAYQLTEGKWTFGYVSSDSDSRWYSVPVTNGNKIYIRMYYRDDDSMMEDVVYSLYRETGDKYGGGPYEGNYIFTPNITGKWYIKVESQYGYAGAFGITYMNSDAYPPKADFWD